MIMVGLQVCYRAEQGPICHDKCNDSANGFTDCRYYLATVCRPAHKVPLVGEPGFRSDSTGFNFGVNVGCLDPHCLLD